jgi:hypothetical protein
MGPVKPPKAISIRAALEMARTGPARAAPGATNTLDAVLEAKKAELLARLGKR